MNMKRKAGLLATFVLSFIVFFPPPTLIGGQDKDQAIQGRKLFLNYCASCHGSDASGNGPVASSLKNQPPDLRKLQLKSKYSSEQIRKAISGEMSLMVHGKKEMPVWGLILSKPDITNLVKYIESIQRPFDPLPAE
jgi:mono/diheme cytochrome c family protein